MKELALEAISGTPGTSGSLTVTAVSSPVAFPRMSDVGVLSTPIAYTIEDSTGLVICSGWGYSTAAGAFTRVVETSQWGGSSYTRNPSALYSLPSGCVIYCGTSKATQPDLGQPITTQMWFEPNGLDTNTTGFTPTANRDYFWRFVNTYPYSVDAVAVHASGSIVLDLGIYSVNLSDGKPAILLIGWKGVSLASGMNTITMASATLGALSAAAQALPTGDLMFMANLSSGNFGRSVSTKGSRSGSIVSDLNATQCLQYVNRTNNTSFASNPTITGRFTSANVAAPLVAFRAT